MHKHSRVLIIAFNIWKWFCVEHWLEEDESNCSGSQVSYNFFTSFNKPTHVNLKEFSQLNCFLFVAGDP